jgi:hypothetical protein
MLTLNRNKFETYNLVYLPSSEIWCPPSACVWTPASKVGEQFGVAEAYGELKDFFVGKLSIREPTAWTYIAELKNLSTEVPPDSEKIKQTLQTIQQLNPTSFHYDSIQHLKCLPIKLADGSTQLASATDPFLIIDRIEYGSLFSGSVTILDLNLQETHELQSSISALGLTNRYMSSLVTEQTTVRGPSTQPSAILSRNFRYKAKAIYR